MSCIPSASTDEVEAAKTIVRNLLIPYDPENVGNPRLMRYYAELEALALERPSAVDSVADHTSAFHFFHNFFLSNRHN